MRDDLDAALAPLGGGTPGPECSFIPDQEAELPELQSRTRIS